MRAARRQCMLGAVRSGIGPSPRLRARAPPAQHFLGGGYKRSLHAFQGGQRHHGRLMGRGGGGARGSNCRRDNPGDAALGHALR